MRNFTKNILVNEWTGTIQDIVNEVIENDFQDNTDGSILVTERDDLNEKIDQLIWEGLDGCEEVIYTYQAKDVCEALQVDIFDTSAMTGENFNSWSQAAFDSIYTLIQEEDLIDQCLTNHFADKFLNQ